MLDLHREQLSRTARLTVVGFATAAYALWIWNLSASHTKSRVETEHSVRDYAVSAGEEIAANCIGLSSPRVEECIAREIAVSRENERGEQNLEAQRQMALWTMVVGITAMVSLPLSMVGIGLVYITFRETRKAADIAARTHSAFVDVESAKIVAETHEMMWNPPHIMGVKIHCANIGRSTADLMYIKCSYMAGCQYPDKFEQAISAEYALPKDQTVDFLVRFYDEKIVVEKVFFGGYVAYRNHFGIEKRSYFLGRIGAVEDTRQFAIDPRAIYCSREEREGRFGWPHDD